MLTALRGQKLPPEWIHIASPGDIPSWVKGKGIEDQLWRRKGLQIASKGHNWFEATVAMSAFKCMSQSQLRHVCLLSISDMSYFFFGYLWSLVVYRQTWLTMFDRFCQGALIAIVPLEIKEDLWCTSVPWHFCFQSLFLAFGLRKEFSIRITKTYCYGKKSGDCVDEPPFASTFQTVRLIAESVEPASTIMSQRDLCLSMSLLFPFRVVWSEKLSWQVRLKPIVGSVSVLSIIFGHQQTLSSGSHVIRQKLNRKVQEILTYDTCFGIGTNLQVR